MPIKWRQFKESEKPFRFPQMPPVMPNEEEWSPFMPGLKPDITEDPAVDIYQDKNNLYVEFPLIGIKPENVDISIEDNILTIQGQGEEKKEIKKEDYLQKEIRKGSFRRVIKLPVDVISGKATAESVGNILKITIPKAAKAIPKSKRIPIKIK